MWLVRPALSTQLTGWIIKSSMEDRLLFRTVFGAIGHSQLSASPYSYAGLHSTVLSTSQLYSESSEPTGFTVC